MIAPNALPEAQPGERIRPAYNALVRELRRWRMFPGEGVRIFESPQGTMVIRVPEPPVWMHAWKVSLGDGVATVAPGRVNGEMPTLDGTPLDGLDDKGEVVAVEPPRLKIRTQEPKDQWIVLRVRADKDFRLLPGKATIETTTTASWLAGYSGAQRAEGGGAWMGDFPLALVRGGRAWQIAHFHVRARAQRLGDNRGRFWFFV